MLKNPYILTIHGFQRFLQLNKDEMAKDKILEQYRVKKQRERNAMANTNNVRNEEHEKKQEKGGVIQWNRRQK